MTKISFDTDIFSPKEKDDIEHVLGSLVIDGREELWRTAPDEIRIQRLIAGGRSGAKVLEAVVVRGNSSSRTVIKVAPHYSLCDEFDAFRKLLCGDYQSPRFVPIETVTRRLLDDPRQAKADQLEAVAYRTPSIFTAPIRRRCVRSKRSRAM